MALPPLPFFDLQLKTGEIDVYVAVPLLVGLLVAFVVGTAVVRYRALTAKQEQEAYATKHKDRVVLFQFPRPADKPSGSPFCVKGETMLRFLSAPYDNEFALNNRFPRGKLPVYEWNGKMYEDSQLGYGALVADGVLEDLDAGLSENKAAVGRAFRHMIELLLNNSLVYERWIEQWPRSGHEFFLAAVPYPIRLYLMRTLQPKVKASLDGTVGRYPSSDIYGQLVPDSLSAVSTQLGESKWLLDTTSPTTADAALFGFLATAIYHKSFSPKVADEIMKHPNIVAFFNRVRSSYWPEWENLFPEEEPAPPPKARAAAKTRKTADATVVSSGESSGETVKVEEPELRRGARKRR